MIAYLDLSAPIFLVNILRKPNLYCSLTRLNCHNPLSTFSLTACFFFFFFSLFFFSFSLALGLSSFSFQFRLQNKGDCKISVNLIPFKRVFKVNINALRGYCIYYTLLSQLFTQLTIHLYFQKFVLYSVMVFLAFQDQISCRECQACRDRKDPRVEKVQKGRSVKGNHQECRVPGETEGA